MNFMLIAFEAGYKFDNGKCQRPTQKINVLKKFNNLEPCWSELNVAKKRLKT